MRLLDNIEDKIFYGNEISLEIDKLTDCLVDRKTQICYNTIYELIDSPISKVEAKQLQKDGWKFDWSIPQEKGYDIYRLKIQNDDTIQGLIAIKHYNEQYFTRIDLVEAHPQNIGINGKYVGVGGNLFAIACKLSFENGNDGYVQFIAKTKLIEHYKHEIYAKQIEGQSMYIDTNGAKALLEKYFKKE